MVHFDIAELALDGSAIIESTLCELVVFHGRIGHATMGYVAVMSLQIDQGGVMVHLASKRVIVHTLI